MQGKTHFSGSKIFFHYILKRIVLGTTKFGVHKKILGATSPNAPCGYGPVGMYTFYLYCGFCFEKLWSQ